MNYWTPEEFKSKHHTNETMQALDKYFKISERGSSFSNELHGAAATFLTMSYILLVNPQVLAKIGIAPKEVVVATALSGGIASIVCGALGNLPFGLSPGIGLSAYLVYGLVLSQSMPLHRAFTACFISGLILCILSITGATSAIMRFIPKSVKLGVVAGMGMQIALVGMTMVDMVVANPHTIVGLGPLDNYRLWLCFIGMIAIGSMMFHNVPGAILIGIIALTLISWYVENTWPTSFVMYPQMQGSISDYIRFDDIDWPSMGPAIIAFLFIGIVDVGAVVFGMASMASITEDSGVVPGSLFAFLGCGVGTLIGAATGSTPVIVYVETATGIKAGGRTGFTGCIIGLLFLISLFLAPVFSEVPTTATAPVSILIGAMMMSQSAFVDWNNMSEAIPAFLTMVIMPFTFSITNGILFGLIAAIAFSITTGRAGDDIKYSLGYTTDTELSVEMTSTIDETTALKATRSPVGNGRKSPTPNTTDVQDYMHLPRSSSLRVTEEGVVRTPSLLVSEAEAKEITAAHGLPMKDHHTRHGNLSNEGSGV